MLFYAFSWCEWAGLDTGNFLASDAAILPASELIDVSHQLHQQLINLMVGHLSTSNGYYAVSVCEQMFEMRKK